MMTNNAIETIQSYRDNSRRDMIPGDRRMKKFHIKYLFRGRRKSRRRCQEENNFYVDRFSSFEISLFLVLVFLNLADLVYTNFHLSNGASEANPVLNYALSEFGFLGLTILKMFVVIGSSIFLLIHIKFNYSKSGLIFLNTFYTALLIYHYWGHSLLL